MWGRAEGRGRRHSANREDERPPARHPLTQVSRPASHSTAQKKAAGPGKSPAGLRNACLKKYAHPFLRLA